MCLEKRGVGILQPHLWSQKWFILGPLISHNTDIQNKQKELTTLHRQSHFVNKCKNMLAPSTFLQVDVIQHNGI